MKARPDKDLEVGLFWKIILLWPSWIMIGFIRLLGRLTLFLLDYNENRPDLPRSY